jgi:2-C-methyl-D-erythritol 4-phosphate cytidylyltransferase/2-C-methyl-D-erythritol 2,4-cyclodiphosphate synthase
MTKKFHTIALLVAAGTSERMQSEIPKPYLQLGNENILHKAIKTFQSHPQIDGVRVVIRREHHPFYRRAIEGLTLFPCVIGGNTRQESVRLGLESVANRNPTLVLVHDVARPLADHALISRVLKGLESSVGVIPALPLTDTVKRAKDGKISETISREHLYTVQTPQGFHFDTLLAAHQKFKGEALTDDAAVMEKAGEHVTLVAGDVNNIKVTSPEDLQRMQTLSAIDSETRVGTGFDVHQLKEHDLDAPVQQKHIKICGIKIPYTHYLEGHSDADVGLHALVDAMLGAIGAGDIGIHFPPDDPRWSGADSERFVLHAYEMLKNCGGEIVNLDITLICEKPKISEHRTAMVKHIAQLMKISPNRVNIKATTTEKLGFTGRSEGIAAQAVATVRISK